MSCDRTDSVLHAYFDNELDPVSASEFERHLAECAECTKALEPLKSLRSSIGTAQLYQALPDSLRNKVLLDLNIAEPVSALPARTPWKWLAIAAVLLILAATSWQLLSLRLGIDENSILASAVVDAHLRSLQPGHLTDVLSSDQHTVKPWFAGKLDFAPPVKDFAEQGFPLQGGRLDVVHGRTVPALVYGRHKHIVSVFMWPTNENDSAPHHGSTQGYEWIEWRKSGVYFCAVSDTSSSDLEQLQRLFSE
jgi:anti-sigma factor RsiW